MQGICGGFAARIEARRHENCAKIEGEQVGINEVSEPPPEQSPEQIVPIKKKGVFWGKWPRPKYTCNPRMGAQTKKLPRLKLLY